MRWWRAPLLHFILGGAGLFLVVHGAAPFTTGPAPAPAEPVIVTAADVARLRAEYTRETGLPPTPDDEAALVQKAVEEELLFREALARGLDRHDKSVRNWLVEQMAALGTGGADDPDRLYARARALGLDRTDLVVRRILVQQMRLLAAHVDDLEPSAAELAAFYAAHRAEYAAPERMSFWHVFVSGDRHGTATRADAAALLAALRRDGVAPADGVRRGDTFVAPPYVAGQSPAQVAKVFGPAFAAALAGEAPERWVGPVSSPYGAHLVWLTAHEAGLPPPLEAVRGRVLERWREDHRAARVEALLQDLGHRIPLQVESQAWQERRRS